MNRPIPARASRHRADATTDAFFIDEDALYTTKPHTSVVKRYNVGMPVRQPPDTLVREETQETFTSLQRLLLKCAIMIGIGLFLAWIWLNVIMPPLTDWNNDRLYGYPRMFRAEANVGHGTTAHPMTRFLAVNNNGYIQVLELPEDTTLDSTHIHLYGIIHIEAENANKVPITNILFNDINGDGKPDLEVVVNDAQYPLINDGTQFKQQQ